MYLGFIRFKKQLSFFIFSGLISVTTFNLYANVPLDTSKTFKQEEILKVKQKKETTNLTTAERTLLKTAVATTDSFLRKYKGLGFDPKKKLFDKNDYKIDMPDFYFMAKTFGNYLIDEFVPKAESSQRQKLIELIIPTIISITIFDIFSIFEKAKKDSKKLTQADIPKIFTDLTLNITLKVLKKLILVRFMQKPGTTNYAYANSIAIMSGFVNPKDFATGFVYPNNFKGKYINIKNKQYPIQSFIGLEIFAAEKFKKLIISMDFGKTLNKSYRKKAIADVIKAFGIPAIQFISQSMQNMIPVSEADKKIII